MTSAAGRRMAPASPTPRTSATRRISTSMCRMSRAATRQRVFDGSNMVSVSGFRSDGATLALLHDRGFGDMSLLLLDRRDRATRSRVRIAEQLPERPLGERRTDAAGADRSRRRRLPAAVPAGSGNRRGHRSSMKRAGATWRPGRSRLMRSTLATVENDRGYAVLRVGPHRRRAPGGHRSAARRRHRSGLVTRRQHAGVQCRRADGAAVALAVARWRRRAWYGSPKRVRSRGLRRFRTGGVGELRRHTHSRLVRVAAHAASRPAVIPRSSGCMAGRSARRGRTSGPTSRCCSRRASPCCCRMCAAVPAMAAPTPRATMSNDGSTA